MKRATQLPPNPFDQDKDPGEVLHELLKRSKPLSHEEALRRMKEAAEAQKQAKR